MSMDIDRSPPGGFETLVAREHWEPIARSAMAQGGVLALIALILGMPLYGALSLVHIMTLFGAIFSNIMALRLDEQGNTEAAVRVGRRSLGALAVSSISLLVLTLAG
ncbi:hypothetical protein [Azospirillum halopraeferens]|uniref:hypothetical protein n=1 Tax=Azospirillum halopraeferens TaxID=34010 RepID=UPI0004232971|nr:hypothetical protein [Azospirillum halopraeferens]